MRPFLAFAGTIFAVSIGHAEPFLFTVPTTVIGLGEALGTVYASRGGARAAVQVCRRNATMNGFAYTDNQQQAFSTDDCTVVVGDRVVIRPNSIGPQVVDVSLLGVESSGGPTHSPDGTFSFTTAYAHDTVYFGNGRLAVVKVCSIAHPVTVVAWTGPIPVRAKITSYGDCTVVAGDKVELERYTSTLDSETFQITILSVSGIYKYVPQ